MSTNAKKIWTAIGIAVGALAVYLVYRFITKGIDTVKADLAAAVKLATWPATVFSNAATTVAGNAAAAASLPSLANQSAALDQQLTTINTNDYAPGGRIYIKIANEQGTLAADAAWQKVQDNLASQTADTASWWQIWK